MRRAVTLVAGALVALGLTAGPAAAAYDDPIVSFPLCNLEGQCGPTCSVYLDVKQTVRCGY